MSIRGEAAPFEPTRREVVVGGMLFAGLFIAGCQTYTPPPRGDTMRPSGDPLGVGSRPGSVPPPYEPPAPLPPPGVMPRSTWTRAGVARPSEINPMGGVRRITIHHDGMTVFTSTSQGDAAARLEQIRQSHVAGRKWADIGYHYIIDPAGRVWEGRSVRYQGAHVQDNNENNLGIMMMGNFDLQRPTAQQQGALDRFVASQMRLHRVALSRVYTHQEIKPTACPGRNLQTYMVSTRRSGGRLALALAETGDGTLLA
ncbi:MAG: N-acetylmuramoyl-L-alanine amidase [Phycisphaerae bacterium]|nr:N-acetylmuramoyl-L-alanine amidase [Phycisphaerae bacterium]